MATPISIKFLGVRSVHSAPSRSNQTTGGNTGCIELFDGSQRIFINAGFGINISGDELFAKFLSTKIPVNCTVLFSDFLWDSILGLPFFTPIHFKSTEMDIFSGAPKDELISAMNDASSNLYSPFNGVESFRSDLSLRQIDSTLSLGDWTIQAKTLPHPLTPYPITLWRLSHTQGADIGIVMICNNDKASLDCATEFLKGCKTLICAASNAPFQDGWDRYRTTFQDALHIAKKSKCEELYLTQFHPGMDDLLLQKELHKLRELHFRKDPGTLKIRLATETEAIHPSCAQSIKKAG